MNLLIKHHDFDLSLLTCTILVHPTIEFSFENLQVINQNHTQIYNLKCCILLEISALTIN